MLYKYIWSCLKQSEKQVDRWIFFHFPQCLHLLLCLLWKFVGVGILKASTNGSRSVFTESKKENIKFIHLCAFCFFCVNAKLAFSLQKRLYGSQWGSSSCYIIYMRLAHAPCCFNDKLYRRPWSNACSRPLDRLKVL